jgi:hypothetical protein
MLYTAACGLRPRRDKKMKRGAKARNRKASAGGPTKKLPIKPLPPTSDAARDEGPRLLPLGPMPERTGLEHYLALADLALSQKKKN